MHVIPSVFSAPPKNAVGHDILSCSAIRLISCGHELNIAHMRSATICTCDESLDFLLDIVQYDVVSHREYDRHIIDVPNIVFHICLDTE